MKNLTITPENKVKCTSSGVLYGGLNFCQFGWTFVPYTTAHRSSRKCHATKEQAIPAWVKRAAASVAEGDKMAASMKIEAQMTDAQYAQRKANHEEVITKAQTSVPQDVARALANLLAHRHIVSSTRDTAQKSWQSACEVARDVCDRYGIKRPAGTD